MVLVPSFFLSTIDAIYTLGNLGRRGKHGSWVAACCFVALIVFGASQGTAAQAASTSTTLSVTSAGAGVTTVASGSVVTLTATVVAGTTLVKPGQVVFCDATAMYCSGIHSLGRAQLTSTGTAALKFRPGIGNHSYKAVFSGTNAYASSSSGTTALTVTGTIPVLATATAISETGGWGAYALSATVAEAGNTAAPTGSITFLDANHGNAVLGTGTLGAATRGVNWTNVNTSAPSVAGVTYAVADLNRDGIPDLFFEDYFGTYDVLLGKGDGTFTAVGSPFGPYSQIGSFILGDFNNDGIPDVAAIDGIYLASNNTITIFLGNGDGTFTVASSSPSIGMSPGPIATADINKDGNADLIVDQMDSSGNGQVVIFFGNGDGTFTQASSITSMASTVSSIIPADLNGDGYIDLVLTGNTILLGKGDGTFTIVAGPVGAGQTNASVADFNNDGIPDLAFRAASTSYLTVFLGNGDGTFTAAPSSPNANLKTGNLVIGDFNQDGIPDIVYVGPGATEVGLLFGKGDGTFVQTPATITYPYDFSGYLVVADFDGDGWPDVLTQDGNSGTVIASLTQPTETATASATVSIAVPGTHLANANYGGDSNYYASASGNVSLWGVPPATTTTLTVSSGGAQVTSVPAGSAVTLTATVLAGTAPVTTGQVNFCDASASQCTDIHLLGTVALTSSGTAAFKFVPGPGVHSFKAMFVQDGYGLTSSSAVSTLTVGPANSFAYTDTTAIANSGFPGNYSLTATVIGYGGLTPPMGNVSFLDTSFGNNTLATAPLGASTPGLGWLISQTPALSNPPVSEVAGDFNGDGIPDLALLWTNSGSNTGEVTIFLGKGDGTFTTGPTTQAASVGQTYSGMVVGDFNDDGKLDMVMLYCSNGAGSSSARTFLGNGDGSFAVSQSSVTLNWCTANGLGFTPGTAVAADLNGDGKLDVAFAGDSGSSGGVTALLGNGDGSFTTKISEVTPGQDFNFVVVGDFNGDGIPDLVATNPLGATSATVFLGKGDGTFTALPTPLTVSASFSEFVYSITAGDFNGDGKLDLAISEFGGVVIYLGNGDGTFNQTSASPIAVPDQLNSLTMGDFNHDGKLDLAGIDNYSNRIVLLIGAGDGTFTVTSTTPVLNNSNLRTAYIVPADFNGDGVPDLALMSSYANTASILLTEPTETATATVTGLAPVGAGTHNVQASYAGDSNYPSSVSGTVALTAGLTPLVLSPAPGTYSTEQTVTISESIPGATIYYYASGTLNTNGYVVYTGPIQLTVGGIESIQAYATETGYQQTDYVRATYTINLPIAPAPQLSLSSGYYPTAQTLTISDTVPGASIYYTTNGQTPTQSSTLYAGPIAVSSSDTVAAIAISAGYTPSPATVAQYVIGSSSTSFIYTVAGTGTTGYTGDGDAATLAELDYPMAAVKDAAGNIYIADQGNHVVRKVAAGTGVISTIAGNGTIGYGGDGGPGKSATLSSPVALALDTVGNLFIADGGGIVRELNLTSGIISTYAGNPTGPTYVSGSQATAVFIPGLWGIAIDASRNVYLSSQGSILKVTNSTAIITTIAGSTMSPGYGGDNGPAGSANLYFPEGLALDASGNMYIADRYNYVVRKITATGGVITSNSIITTVAGTPQHSGLSDTSGPATSTLLSNPVAVAVDGSNNLYIADVGTDLIWLLNTSTGNLTKVTGHLASCNSLGGDGGPAAIAAVCNPYGLSVDAAGNLLVADSGLGRVREILAAAVPPSTQAAAPTFSLAPGTYPTVQTVTISDATSGASIYLTVDGSTPTTVSNGYSFPINVAGSMTIKAVATAPGYLTSAPASASYAVTTYEPVISTIAGNGTQALASNYGLSGLGAGGPAANVKFAEPEAVAIDKAGNIFVSDTYNNIVWKFAAGTGTASVFAGTGTSGTAASGILATNATLNTPIGLGIDSAGNLYIADRINCAVRKVNAATGIISTVAGTGNTPATATGDGVQATSVPICPYALALDGADNLYIPDSGHRSIRKVSAQTGIISTVAGNGTNTLSGDGGPAMQAGIGSPNAIAVSFSGDIYLSAAYSGVRKITATTGIISTVAGNLNVVGETGDGGPATSAQLYQAALALDPGGNLYISSWPGAIREVNATTGVISRVAGEGFPGFSGDAGPALIAQLKTPYGLAFDPAGNLVFADLDNYRIRKITMAPQTVATPLISVPTGTYTSSQTVTITDTTSGSTIYYTIDGSTPTAASTAYSGPITITSSETLNAIAVAVNYNQSAVASATYTIKLPITPAIAWATPAAITYGTALSATQLNATASVPGTFVYSPAVGIVLGAGQQTLTATFTPTDTTDYTTATTSLTLTVNKAAPGIALVSSANPAYVSNPVTFTATLTSTPGAPTGTVSFYDTTTLLGMGTLSAGVATYTTSSLIASAHPITAVYSGDSNFATVTSSALSETVENFTIGLPTGGAATVTASPGGQAVYTFVVSPPSGGVFGGAITFTVAGLPTGATATFSPTTIPSGAGATNVTMTVSLPSSAEARPLPRPFSGGALPLTLGLILLPFAGRLRRASWRLNKTVCLMVLAVAGLALAMGLTACGGSSAPTPRNYSLTITGTSGSLSNTFNVTLIVQ